MIDLVVKWRCSCERCLNLSFWVPWAVCWWKTFPDPDPLTGLSHHQSVWRRRLWTLIALPLWQCHASWFFRSFCKQPIQRVGFEGFEWLTFNYDFHFSWCIIYIYIYWFNVEFLCGLALWLHGCSGTHADFWQMQLLSCGDHQLEHSAVHAT